eukprot:2796387-Pleurochrysis_carterae.AAC.1
MPSANLPQFGPELVPPADGPENWLTDHLSVIKSAPLVSMGVINSWAREEKLIHNNDGNTFLGLSFKRGASRCLNNPRLDCAVSKHTASSTQTITAE